MPIQFYSKIKKIKIDGVYSLQLFNIFRFVATLGIGVLLAKSGLPIGEISIYETLIFLSNLVSFFWVVGGINAFLQLFPTLKESEKRRAIFNIFLIFLIVSLFFSGILFLLKNTFFEHFNNGEALPYLNLICLYIIFNTPTLLIHFYFLLLKKFREILIFGAVIFITQMLVICLPIYLNYSLEISFWGLLILAFLKFIYCIIILIENSDWKIDLIFLKKYAALGLPLILYILIGSSVEYIDGLIVKSQFSDEDTFAIFRFGAREFPISLLLVSALVSALVPEIAVKKRAAIPLIKSKSLQLMKWVFPLSCIMMIASPFLYPLVYNADFQESAHIFNVYLLILCSRILLPHSIVMGFQHNYILVISAIIETIVNVSLSLIFVQNFGLVGIAFASLIAYSVNKILLIIFCHFKLKIPIWEYVALPQYFVFSFFLVGSYFLANVFLP